MITNIISWLVIGLVAGLLVNSLGPIKNQYSLGTIGAAIIGAFVGGVVYSGVKIGTISSEIDTVSLLVSIAGAVVLMFFIIILVKNEDKREINNN